MGPTVHIPETERRRRQGGAATARVGRNGDAARSPRVRALSYRGSTGLNGYGLGSAGVLGLARSVPYSLIPPPPRHCVCIFLHHSSFHGQQRIRIMRR